MNLAEVTMTVDTAQYADGDVLAATQELNNALPGVGQRGLLRSVVVLDPDDQGVALDVVIFRSDVALGIENAALSIADADASEILAVVEVAAGDYVDLIGSQIAVKDGLSVVLDAPSDSRDLYVGLISRGTGTYAGGEIGLKLGIE